MIAFPRRAIKLSFKFLICILFGRTVTCLVLILSATLLMVTGQQQQQQQSGGRSTILLRSMSQVRPPTTITSSTIRTEASFVPAIHPFTFKPSNLRPVLSLILICVCLMAKRRRSIEVPIWRCARALPFNRRIVSNYVRASWI